MHAHMESADRITANAAFDAPPSHVDAPPGTELLLEVDGVYGHLKSELVGYRAGHYLVVRTPVGPPGMNAKLYRGNMLVMRYLHEGNVYGCQTSVLGTASEPEPLLFLGSPKLMQEKSLRSAKRLDTYILCKAAIQHHTVEGTLIDVSRKGLRCILASRLPDDTVLRPRIGDRIAVNAELAGASVAMVGVVRNEQHFPASVQLGVAFEGNDRATEEQIVAFLIRGGVEG
jgi:hypothetical protein